MDELNQWLNENTGALNLYQENQAALQRQVQRLKDENVTHSRALVVPYYYG